MVFRLPEDFSFQHPITGEWAHHRSDLCREALGAFVEPAAELIDAPLAVLEVGFGRGLNTAMSLWWLETNQIREECYFLGFEPFPLLLNPWPVLTAEVNRWFPWWGNLLNPWKFGDWAQGDIVIDHVIPRLARVDVKWDWIFLDLFSPNRHPEVWQAPLAQCLAANAAEGAVLTTYSCSRKTRELLAQGGWETEIIRHKGFRDTLRAQLCKN